MTDNIVIKIQKIDFQWQMEDPFLFCAHHKDAYPKGNENQGINQDQLGGRNIGNDFVLKDGFRMYHGDEVPGFPVHPHRGFETVTVVTEGFVDHFDSLGASGRYGNGDVQWLTTGKGCQHSELFPLIHENKPNPTELLQIWLNLSKKNKFSEPAYKMFWNEDIPIVEETNINGNKTSVRVIAGSLKGKIAINPNPDSWAADSNNNVGIFLIHMEAHTTLSIPATFSTANRNLYFYSGQTIHINNNEIKESSRIKLMPDQTLTIQNGNMDSYLLLLEGEPINEPVVQYGPFVMNTELEIQQAYQDYQRTQFGGWPWDPDKVVNKRTASRFAHFADGTEEIR